MGLAMEQAKAVLVEKYLFEKYGLTISQDKLDGYQTSLKNDVKDAGGQGAYKQYYGYTAKTYYSIYAPMVDRSDMLFKHLTETKDGGTGELALCTIFFPDGRYSAYTEAVHRTSCRLRIQRYTCRWYPVHIR